MLNFTRSVDSERNKMGKSISHKKGSFQTETSPLSCISCSVKAEGWKAAADPCRPQHKAVHSSCQEKLRIWSETSPRLSLRPTAPTLLIYLEQHHHLQKQVFTLLPAPEFCISAIQTRTRNSCFIRKLIIWGKRDKLNRAHLNGNTTTLCWFLRWANTFKSGLRLWSS